MNTNVAKAEMVIVTLAACFYAAGKLVFLPLMGVPRTFRIMDLIVLVIAVMWWMARRSKVRQ
jgi:hypothetical protein